MEYQISSVPATPQKPLGFLLSPAPIRNIQTPCKSSHYSSNTCARRLDMSMCTHPAVSAPTHIPTPIPTHIPASTPVTAAGATPSAPTTTETLEKQFLKAAKKQQQAQQSKGKMYRVYIFNDPFNTKAYVISVLLKVVVGLTFSQANAVMMQAHEYGMGLVTVTQQELAEMYCEQINDAGVFSTAEPDE